jgi:hypothetical protein
MKVFSVLLFFFVLFLLYNILTFERRKMITVHKTSKYNNTFKSKLVPKSTINTRYVRVFEPQDIIFNNGIMDDPRNYLDDRLIQFGDSGSQDVHDSYIQNGLSGTFKESESDLKTEAKFSELLSFSGKDPEILDVLTKIKKRNCKMVKYDDRPELDIIYDTFKTGTANVKSQVMTVLREMFREGITCPTGTVSRVREASFIEYPEKMPVSKKDLQQQMLAKASIFEGNTAALRNHLVSHYSDVYPEKDIHEIIDEWKLD